MRGSPNMHDFIIEMYAQEGAEMAVQMLRHVAIECQFHIPCILYEMDDCILILYTCVHVKAAYIWPYVCLVLLALF